MHLDKRGKKWHICYENPRNDGEHFKHNTAEEYLKQEDKYTYPEPDSSPIINVDEDSGAPNIMREEDDGAFNIPEFVSLL